MCLLQNDFFLKYALLSSKVHGYNNNHSGCTEQEWGGGGANRLTTISIVYSNKRDMAWVKILYFCMDDRLLVLTLL